MDEFLQGLFGGTSMGTGLFGAPGAGRLFDDMPIPGMPMTGGATPQADMPAIGAQAIAGGPGTPGFAVPGQPSAGATLRSEGPPLPTPAQRAATDPPAITIAAPKGATTPPGLIVPPSQGGIRPVESRNPTPPGGAPPAIDTTLPTAGGAPVGGAAAPAAAPAAGTPGAVPEEKTGLQRLMESLGKLQAGGGGGQPKAGGGGMGGVGAAHIPQGGADLFRSILEGHAKGIRPVGAVPTLPPALLRHFGG